MAHNIYQNKFASFKKPAWHGLGEVFDTPTSSLDAGLKLGIPQVFRKALTLEDGTILPDHVAIVGVDKGIQSIYSVVSKDYQEITHGDFLLAFDSATEHANVETIGLLGNGHTLFVSTKLPNFNVKGDECENYLLAFNPLTGFDAATGRITPVRVVCQNTLNMSAGNFREQFRVIHTSDAAKDIKAWLEMVWKRTVEQTQAVQEAFDILANLKVSTQQFSEILKRSVYPSLSPVGSASEMDNSEAWATYEAKMDVHRDKVLHLFDGDMVGFTDAAKGTAWGAYNSVVEYEDYGKKHRRASSRMVGAGASRKDIAFKELLSLA